MKEDKISLLKLFNLISIVFLYYILGSKNLFLYVLSFSLYNIFMASFDGITIKASLQNLETLSSKKKLFRVMMVIISFIWALFILLSILISDLVSVFLNIDNILPIFVVMSISLITKPCVKIIAEYLENIKHNRHYTELLYIYHELDYILIVIIALITFRVFKLDVVIATASLYLSKIFSAIIVMGTLYLLNRPIKHIKVFNKDNANYFKEVKKVLTKNSTKSTINIVRNSYYYLSIIILYLVFSTRYNYKLDDVQEIISFVYFYALSIVDYLIYVAKLTIKGLPSDMLPTDKVYNSFKAMLPMAIIFGVISPLTCRVIFNDPSKSIYLVMINFMAIFVLLYDLTFDAVKNKLIINVSLISGLLVKVITIIPLINAFYRMGYNLVYGDVVSTIIALFTSIIINYIHLKKINPSASNYFEKLLNILYENILLGIILILAQFIVPLDTRYYFKALGLIIIYLAISLAFMKIKNKK